MIRSLITAGLLASLAVPTLPASAAERDLRGVCAEANMPATPSAALPDPLKSYCAALREGRKRLSDNPAAAIAEFRKTAEVAPRFTDPADRARAEDEARAGLALALEVYGDIAAALRTIQQPGASRPDIIALARGAMLARHGLYTDAAKVLTDIRPLAGECPQMDRAIDHLRRGEPTGFDPIQYWDISSGSFLPSWWFGCLMRYASIHLPDVRSYSVDFDLGKASWPNTAANRRYLADMLDIIRRNEQSGPTTWRLVGHSDQACPKAPQDCQTYNTNLSLRRAEAVKQHLVATLHDTLPDLAQRIQVVGMGMEQPLFESGAADRRNRRIDLAVVLPETSSRAGQATVTRP